MITNFRDLTVFAAVLRGGCDFSSISLLDIHCAIGTESLHSMRLHLVKFTMVMDDLSGFSARARKPPANASKARYRE
jgi:hypothetical protein